MLICYLGAFLGILYVSGCAKLLDQQLHQHILVASLGATAVLLYGVMESKLAQPRNVIGTAHHRALLHMASHSCSTIACLRALTNLMWQCYMDAYVIGSSGCPVPACYL